MTATTKLLLTERQAAEAVGLSTRTLFNLRQAGKLSFVTIGRAIRYRPEDIEAMANKFLVAATAK